MLVEVEGAQLSGALRCNVLARPSRKIRRVCRSSFAAETLEAFASADHAFVARKLYEEMFGAPMLRPLVTDSLNLRGHIRCVANNATGERLPVDSHGLKQYVLEAELPGIL